MLMLSRQEISWWDCILVPGWHITKMSSVMPFTFNAVKLYLVTIKEKPWTRAKEVCRALEYEKATKSADIVKHLCSKEKFAHKWQLIGFVPETKPINWSKDSQEQDIYINKEGTYQLVFLSQQLKAKNFRRHCCNVMFPQIPQYIMNKMNDSQDWAIRIENMVMPCSRNNLRILSAKDASLPRTFSRVCLMLKTCVSPSFCMIFSVLGSSKLSLYKVLACKSQ